MTIQIPIWPPSWCTGSDIERSRSCCESAAHWLFPLGTTCQTWQSWFRWSWFKFPKVWLCAYKLQFFWHMSLWSSVPHSLPSRWCWRDFSLKSLFSLLLLPQLHRHSWPPEVHPFSGIFACCCDSCHCLWVVSQLPGQPSMSVVPQHLALHPTTTFLPVGLF